MLAAGSSACTDGHPARISLVDEAFEEVMVYYDLSGSTSRKCATHVYL